MTHIEIETFFLMFAGLLLLVLAFVSVFLVILTLFDKVNQKIHSNKQAESPSTDVRAAMKFINLMNKVKQTSKTPNQPERRRMPANVIEINTYQQKQNEKRDVEQANEAFMDILGTPNKSLDDVKDAYQDITEGKKLKERVRVHALK